MVGMSARHRITEENGPYIANGSIFKAGSKIKMRHYRRLLPSITMRKSRAAGLWSGVAGGGSVVTASEGFPRGAAPSAAASPRRSPRQKRSADRETN
jgi:hypothetical protein